MRAGQRRVDVVADGGPHGELGKAVASHRVGRHHAVGASALEAGLGGRQVGAPDDEEPGVQRSRGEDHVDVVDILVDGRHEARGAIDAGGQEGDLGRGVALHDEVAGRPRPLDGLGQDVHHDDAPSAVLELAGHRGADSTEAADDVVTGHGRDPFLHLPPLPASAADLGQHDFRHDAHAAEEQHGTSDGGRHGHDAPRLVQGPDHAVAHRREGGDGHEQRV